MQVVRQNQRRNISLSVALLLVDLKEQVEGIDQDVTTTTGRVENGEFLRLSGEGVFSCQLGISGQLPVASCQLGISC